MNAPRHQVAADALVDRCGRPVRSLRVSVTDRCNLRCTYCMPAEGLPHAAKADRLSFDEIVRIVRVAGGLGIDRIRITGGEPLLRPGLSELIRRLKSDAGAAEISLTSNALLLSRHAASLRDAGLDRINISLDALDPERFEKLTRMRKLEAAWEGIEAASNAGFDPLRINNVVVREQNDQEFGRWVELTRTRNILVRFLELMPIGEGARLWNDGGFVDLTEKVEQLRERFGLEPTSDVTGNGPARYWRVPGAKGALGFITPLSNHYCDSCTRFRLTSTGGLRPCLAHDLELPLGNAARDGNDAAIRDAFIQAAALKPAGHHWRDGQITRTGMSQMGG